MVQSANKSRKDGGGMSVSNFFKELNWKATIQLAAIRILIASAIWTVLMQAGNPNFSIATVFQTFFGILALFFVFVAIAIPAIGLATAGVPFVGLAALPAWLISIGDPIVKWLHKSKPQWVPVDNFGFFNPPVLTIFGPES